MSKNKVIIVVAVLALAFGMMACKSSGDGHNKGKATASGKTINLNGGNGTTGEGGDGGTLYFYWYSLGGIKLLKEGEEPDTSFAIPNYPEYVDLGATSGWEVDASYSVQDYPAGVDTAVDPGEYHTHKQISTLWQRNAGGTADGAVTGVRIARGVTLTINPNMSSGGTACQEWAYIELDNDLEILGTLTANNLTRGLDCTATPEVRHGANALPADIASLDFRAQTIFIRPSGFVTTAGADATAAGNRGGDGASIYLWADAGIINEGDMDASGGDGSASIGGDGGREASSGAAGIELNTDGAIVNKGQMDASGGNGTVGGDAGYVYLTTSSSGTFVYNTGDLYANGGEGSTGVGGAANYIELESYYSSCFNRGNLQANGGDGAKGGGAGYWIYLYGGNSWLVSDMYNSGALEVNGGDALTNGDGGDAGGMQLYAYGSELRSNGRIEGYGGEGLGAGNTGGAGADVYFYLTSGGGYWYDYYVQHKDMVISNNITLNGGDGPGGGGEGGYIKLTDDVYYYPRYAPGQLKLVGFNKIEANGGMGTAGGMGGYVEGWTYSPMFDDEGYTTQPAGPIISNSIIEINGGEGSASVGGDAGDVYFYQDLGLYDYADANEDTFTEIGGNILADGGPGVLAGGVGGDIGIAGWYFVKNSALLSANGGDASNGVGGAGGDIDLTSNLNAHNSGPISANGGEGTTTGGAGGEFDFNGGDHTVNSGNIKLHGGDATTTGGAGGTANLTGIRRPARNSGSIDVRGGTGTTPGLLGEIYFDLFDVTPPDGTLGF